MKTPSAATAMGLALLAAFSFVTAATAQNADVPAGQRPPVEQQQTKAPPEPPKCIKDSSGFATEGKRNVYKIELTNTCEQRMRCTVNAYIVGSRGPTRGQAILTLAPKSKGRAAHKVYVIRVKEPGGMANSSYSCKPI